MLIHDRSRVAQASSPRATVAPAVVVVGSVFRDELIEGDGPKPRSFHGGVGRNIAENLGRMGVSVRLVALLAPDRFSDQVERRLRGAGVELAAKRVAGGHGHFVGRVGRDGEVQRIAVRYPRWEALDWPFVRRHVGESTRTIVVETGVGAALVTALLEHAERATLTSIALPTRVREAPPPLALLRRFSCVILNASEAAAILGTREGAASATALNRAGVARAVVTMGRRGVAFGTRTEGVTVHRALAARVVNTLGAGDAFAAGFTGALTMTRDVQVAVRAGLELARCTVEGVAPVAAAPGRRPAKGSRCLRRLGHKGLVEGRPP